MIVILAAALLLLLVLSYVWTGRDIVAPSNVLIITFIVAIFSVLYNYRIWKYDISFYTCFLIISTLSLSMGINGIVHKCFVKRKTIIKKEKECMISEILLAIFTIYMLACIYLQLQQVWSYYSGDGNLSTALYVYRLQSSYGTEAVLGPWYMSQFRNLATALMYVCLFHFIRFYKEMTKLQIVTNLAVILLWVVLNLFNGARFDVFSMVVTAFIMFYLLRIKNLGQYRKFSLKQIFKLSILIILALCFFYFIASFLGRGSSKTIIEYITSYIGGSIPSFDMFVADSGRRAAIWGEETFYSLLQWLRRRGMGSIPYYSYHREFRTIGDIGIGNIYTALRDYYYDFGILGMYFLHMVFSIVFCFNYEKIKVKVSNIGIIYMAIIYNCVVFYLINNIFFGTDCSFSFLIQLVEIYMIYSILIRRKFLNISFRVKI